MSMVRKAIEVDVPVSSVFEEWMRFEELPRFMRGVVAVRHVDDRHLSWRAQIFGVEQVWELEVTEITPERLIAWHSCAGPRNHGVIMLEPLSIAATRITMEIHFNPASFVEEVTDYLGVLDRWVERSLGRFKEMMEPGSRSRGLPPVEELVGQ
jgi:uncharacterized membrane protein